MTERIQLVGMRKSYKGDHIETHALYEISLTLHQNEFTAIVGASGSGKSTLLSLIGTLDQPTSGRIIFGDTDISSLKGNHSQASERRRNKNGRT